MNTVLDVILLRRPLLKYVSPPVCPVTISGSGSGVFFESVEGAPTPTGVRAMGQCEKFIVWDNYAGLECMSLYQAVDPSQIFGSYILVADCIKPGSISVCSPGWFHATALTADGQESAPCADVFSPGGQSTFVQVPQVSGAVRINVYKNPDQANQSSPFALVLSTVSNGAFEVCDLSGCYRIQAVTEDGISELSTPVCRTQPAGCCPAMPCSPNYYWDYDACSCVYDSLTDILGPDNACVGTAYASQFTAIGGVSPFTWTLISGAVNPGLTFHTGLFSGNIAPITGTPSATGSYTFVVGCQSGGGRLFQKTFTIVVAGLDQYPSLPVATTDIPYSEQLTSIGGVTFSLITGSLPPGLTMTSAGLISGVPSHDGGYALTIAVTDAAGSVCSVFITLVVVPCPVVFSHPTIAVGRSDINYGSLDIDHSVWWLPSNLDFPSSAMPALTLFDSFNLAVLGLATDPLHLVNTEPKGDWGSGTHIAPVIDTKNNQAVICGNQRWTVWFNLNTRAVISVDLLGLNGGILNEQYDSKRGVIWAYNPNVTAFHIDRIVCATHTLSTMDQAGVKPVGCVYCPDNDMIYLGYEGGGNLFYTINPSDAVPALSAAQGFGTGAPVISLRYLAGIGLLLFTTTNGTVVIDPKNGNANVTTIAGVTAPVDDAVYDSCNGLVYLSSGSLGQGITSYDPNNAWASGVVSGPAHTTITFDRFSNQVLGLLAHGTSVETF
jgi:hypothetical protein